MCAYVHISLRVRLPSFSLGYDLTSWKSILSMTLSPVPADGAALRCRYEDKITAISREKPDDEEREPSERKSLYSTLAPQGKEWGLQLSEGQPREERRALDNSSRAQLATFSQKAFSVSFMKPPTSHQLRSTTTGLEGNSFNSNQSRMLNK